MAIWAICECCGEQEVNLEVSSDGVCDQCLGVASTETEYFGGTITDDIGYRACNCEDFPCCGH